MPKLTIELVPSTCWFSNVRDHVPTAQWDRMRRETYRKARYVCEVCGGRGTQWPVECHEVWHYDDEQRVQTLTGLVALCPACHEVKHIGRSSLFGKEQACIAHLARVNEWSTAEAQRYVRAVATQWERRSQYQWRLNLAWLNERFGIEVAEKR